jgi:glycosyltransferase involved in cell wall biosynthesis
MKVSIITVCYNSEKYIRSAIESVLNQTYKDIQYIVIDGMSNDNTISIVRSYESAFNGRMRWVSEKDKGIYDAMNKGILMSTGDLIAILNSDDIYIDNKIIEDVVEQLQKNDVDTIYGNIEFVEAENTGQIKRIWKSSTFFLNSFRKGWHPPHPAFFVKKSVYNKYGVFDTSIDVSADFELMLRFLERYKVSTVYINRFVVKMRLGGESTGSIKRIIRGNINIIKAFKKNGINVSLLYPLYRLIPKLFQISRVRSL